MLRYFLWSDPSRPIESWTTMRANWRRLLVGSALVAAIGASLLSARSGANRVKTVTLDYSDADLATVVREIERQTRETILVQPGGSPERRITIKVRDVPLEKALGLAARQADAEWARFFAIHSSSASLQQLKNRVTSTNSPRSWTNFPAERFRFPGFAVSVPTEEANAIRYSATNKSAGQIARDLSRLSGSWIVLEDGITNPASLSLEDSGADEAGKALAKKLRKKGSQFFVIRPFFAQRNRAVPAPPGVDIESLPDDLRQALESGKPVQIRLLGEPGLPSRFPPQNAAADNLEEMPLLPPPDPAEEQKRIQERTKDEIRNSTPEQRLERLRKLQPQP